MPFPRARRGSLFDLYKYGVHNGIVYRRFSPACNVSLLGTREEVGPWKLAWLSNRKSPTAQNFSDEGWMEMEKWEVSVYFALIINTRLFAMCGVLAGVSAILHAVVRWIRVTWVRAVLKVNMDSANRQNTTEPTMTPRMDNCMHVCILSSNSGSCRMTSGD